ncbi:ogr/Delta-like zinc finger family protein [Acidovorax kalamii]|uniref:Zinc finger Ogr/Delta-type domain-containing protein n=1 Tax=Acidovorax kalamii TaxID=2004485 RepID=A0A235EH83_9BURK|nr:ogr/Delta-like zinc finger family protein [Acidovorax kalamii]OYD48391.1 hypothetical protein CBY09_20405 [Acidovorax kalamii]
MAAFFCPHCKGRAKTRTSRGLSPTLRELIYQCEDPECSYSFVVQAEAVRTLSPSGKPDPSINLPQSPIALARAQSTSAEITSAAA